MNRRMFIGSVGLWALGAGLANGAGAEMAEVQGVLTFENGGDIPKGQISVTLSDPAGKGLKPEQVLIDSDGTATSIPFAVPLAASGTDKLKIVVRLEREDGWLLARGSALIEPGQPVEVQLNKAVY